MNKTIAGRATIYSGSVYLAQLINIFFVTLLMRVLPTTTFGMFAFGRLIAQYFDYSHLGCRYAMNRYVPVSTEKKNKTLLQVGLFTCVAVSIASLTILYIVGVIREPSVLMLCVGGIFYALSNLYSVYRRDQSDIVFLIKANLYINGVPPLVVLIALQLKILSLFPLVAIYVTTQLLIMVYIFSKNDLFKYIQNVPRNLFKRLRVILSVGGPMLFSSIILMLGMTVDRIFIKFYFGYHAVGVFTAILYVFTFLLILPGALNEVFQPNIVSELRKGVSSAVVYKSLFFFMLLLSPLLVGCYFLTPELVKFFIPEYAPYAHIMSLAPFVLIPYALCTVFVGAMSAIDERKKLVVMNIISLVIYMAFLLFYFSVSKSINYIYLLELKAAYALINFLLYVVVFNSSFSNYKKEIRLKRIKTYQKTS